MNFRKLFLAMSLAILTSAGVAMMVGAQEQPSGEVLAAVQYRATIVPVVADDVEPFMALTAYQNHECTGSHTGGGGSTCRCKMKDGIICELSYDATNNCFVCVDNDMGQCTPPVAATGR